jgi:hypothetical protein
MLAHPSDSAMDEHSKHPSACADLCQVREQRNDWSVRIFQSKLESEVILGSLK